LSTLHDLWIPPEFPECFDSDFLRAGRVANDADDGAGNAFVMNVEERLEFERATGRAAFLLPVFVASSVAFTLYKRRPACLCDSKS
jgi:hypothetical protein